MNFCVVNENALTTQRKNTSRTSAKESTNVCQWMAKQGSFANYKAKVKEVVREFLSQKPK
jgi:hypothetical protein